MAKVAQNLGTPKRSPTLKKVVYYWELYVFLIPAVATVFLFAYRPMVGIVMAFQDFGVKTGYLSSPFVGLKHFRTFLSNPDFYRSLKNTMGLGTLSFLISFPLTIAFALMLNEMRFSGAKKATQTISYLPHFISWIVISTIVIKFLDQDTGILNNLLAALGFERLPFMREPRYFWGVLIFSTIWKETGWGSIIYLAAIAGIDQEMYEAAMIDGANRWKSMLHITLPSISPTIGLLLVLSIGSFINAGGLFDAIYNLTNALVSDSAMILELYTYYEGIAYARYSYATALSLAQAVVSLLMVLGANTVYKKLTDTSAF